MRDGGLRVGEQLDLFGVEANAMCPGDVGADPIRGNHVIGGALAEFLETELILVFCFGDVRVTENLMLLGERARFLQEIERDGEGGAGHQVDARHRVRFRVVECSDDAFAVFHDGGFILHDAIGRQATLAAAE